MAPAEARGEARGERCASQPGKKGNSARVYDALIRGGKVLDGSGRAGFQADVAIERDRIAAIGQLGDTPARR